MKKGAAIFALGISLGGAGAKVASTSELEGTKFVRFELQLPDGGTRDLGRTGCYELGPKVKATVEPCSAR